MQRIDGPSRSAVLPIPAPTGVGGASPGYFSDGDPGTGVPATTVPADWFNMIQEELAGVVEHAGLALDKTNRGQLLAALLATFVARGGGADIEIGNDQFSVPLGGGLILKGGSFTAGLSEGSVARVFTTPFPNGCYLVLATAVNLSGSTTRDVFAQRQDKSAAGFTVTLQYTGGTGTVNSIDGFDWIAIGR